MLTAAGSNYTMVGPWRRARTANDGFVIYTRLPVVGAVTGGEWTLSRVTFTIINIVVIIVWPIFPGRARFPPRVANKNRTQNMGGIPNTFKK